ncbi:MAG: NAD(P)-dependent oxidoreductase [Pseudonocardiaceae bacterium]
MIGAIAMQLTIFGGTGGTGGQLIRAALDAGHTVIAPARDPSKIRASHPKLRTIRADVLDPLSLNGTMDGTDAVVSALGTRSKEPTTVYSTGVANIIDTMRRAGVRRFIGVTALPVTPRTEVSLLERLVVYPILYRFFGEGYVDMARMEQLLRASGVDWTVVRPPMLTDRPATGSYRTSVNHHLQRGRTISRADLAAAILRLIEDPDAVRTTVDVAY